MRRVTEHSGFIDRKNVRLLRFFPPQLWVQRGENSIYFLQVEEKKDGKFIKEEDMDKGLDKSYTPLSLV